MKEEWKPIKGYEEVYEVSNLGLVRRKKKTNSGDVGSLLRKTLDKNGYERVCLCKNGTSKRYSLHRIVAENFLDGNGEDVNHIDGNKSNNCVSNLEWCTHKENMEKAVQTGLIKTKRVRQCINGKVVQIYNSLCDVCRTTGYSKANISKCCQGKRKSAYGYEWKFDG